MKNVVIVDIDGTISKVGDRIKYLQQEPKNWDSFYKACFDDEPINEICDLISELNNGLFFEIYYCTGRRESTRKDTVSWISKHIYDSYWKLKDEDDVSPKYLDKINKHLLMRLNGDHRHDTEVKPELIKKAGIKLSEIAFVLEDRNSMVKKWREIGLKCLQVAEGDF